MWPAAQLDRNRQDFELVEVLKKAYRNEYQCQPSQASQAEQATRCALRQWHHGKRRDNRMRRIYYEPPFSCLRVWTLFALRCNRGLKRTDGQPAARHRKKRKEIALWTKCQLARKAGGAKPSGHRSHRNAIGGFKLGRQFSVNSLSGESASKTLNGVLITLMEASGYDRTRQELPRLHYPHPPPTPHRLQRTPTPQQHQLHTDATPTQPNPRRARRRLDISIQRVELPVVKAPDLRQLTRLGSNTAAASGTFHYDLAGAECNVHGVASSRCDYEIRSALSVRSLRTSRTVQCS